MKRCPQCNQTFDDGTDFCVDDGTRLVSPVNQGQSRVVVSWDEQSAIGEIPTQYVSIPQQFATPQTTAGNPNWLYAVLGCLVAVIVMGGAYLVFVGPQEKDIEKTRVENSPAASNVVDGSLNNFGANRHSFATNAPSNASNTAPSSAANTAPNRASFPISPAGRWAGNWSSPSGAYLKYDLTLSESGGRVDGYIRWTLLRTNRPDKINKVGLSATESM